MADTLTKKHKQRMQLGREEARKVRRYLRSLTTRPPNVEQLRRQLEQLDSDLAGRLEPVDRLEAIQRKLDLEAELSEAERVRLPEDYEPEFIEVAASFSERKGIRWPAWRELGVPARVLREAGIPRTRR